MNNFNINHRYGQSTADRTRQLCNILQKNDVKLFLESIQNLFQDREVSTGNTVARREQAKVEYTNETINRNLPGGWQPDRLSKEEILISQDLYRTSLKLLCDYYEANNTSITNFNKFCFFYLQGCLQSHITELENKSAESFKQALQYFRSFIEGKEDGFSKVQPSPIIESTKARISKHEALPLNPDLLKENASPTSLENALVAKSYIARELCENIYPEEFLLDERPNAYCIANNIDIEKIFKSLTATRFSQLVLLINALDSRFHSRFKIIFHKTMRPMAFDRTSGGTYNQRNTIRINLDLSTYKSALFHELTHKAMNRVFENHNCPYFKENEKAKLAYRESMRQVLINFMLFISPNLEIIDHSLDQLIKEYLVKPNRRILVSLKANGQDEPYIRSLYSKLKTVFTVYLIKNLDIEFITNVSQFINEVDKNSKYFNIIKPLMDFIDVHVIPEMEKYIAEHPCRDQIN